MRWPVFFAAVLLPAVAASAGARLELKMDPPSPAEIAFQIGNSGDEASPPCGLRVQVHGEDVLREPIKVPPIEPRQWLEPLRLPLRFQPPRDLRYWPIALRVVGQAKACREVPAAKHTPDRAALQIRCIRPPQTQGVLGFRIRNSSPYYKAEAVALELLVRTSQMRSYESRGSRPLGSLAPGSEQEGSLPVGASLDNLRVWLKAGGPNSYDDCHYPSSQ